MYADQVTFICLEYGLAEQTIYLSKNVNIDN
nr:MAG TPA: Protein of unknown function (DUF3417) [Caudoviricetes sp.]